MPPIGIKTSLMEGVFTLKTLDDFLLPGLEFEDHGYYSDASKREDLIRFFLKSAGFSAMAGMLTDMMKAADIGEAGENEIRSGMKKIGETFEMIGNGAFLGPGGYRTYQHSADGVVAMVPEARRAAAWAHVMLYCMMCATAYDALSPQVQRALLMRFQPAEECADEAPSPHARCMELHIDNGVTKFAFGWENLPDEPITFRMLVNPLRESASFDLLTPLGRRKVTMPAGGRMPALFVGDTMTCLKGNIQRRRDTAMCRSAKGGLRRMDMRGNYQQEIEIQGSAPDDFAIGEYGNLFVLRKGTLRMPNSRRIDDVLCVFAAGDSWIAMMCDGSTQSNKPQYCEADALAVVEDDGSLHVIRRDGRSEQNKLMSVMLQRFETGDAQVSEQLRLNNGILRLTVDNYLLWEGTR